MKKIFTLLFGIFFSITILNAQKPEPPPQAFSYKAIIYKNGLPVISHIVGLRISILQNIIEGTSVYTEAFQPITNDFGQIDIEIGKGTPESGTFSEIKWGADKYFLKTEVDADGGEEYQPLSVTQLLSVPYALYAGEAKNGFASEYTEGDVRPVLYKDGNVSLGLGKGNPAYKLDVAGDINFTGRLFKNGSPFSPVSASWDEIIDKPTFPIVTTSGSYKDLADKPVTDGSETKVSAGSNITVTGTGTSIAPYVVDAKAHHIGEKYGGGIVFYVYDNGQHGLIAATTDQTIGGGLPWSITSRIFGTAGDGVGAGAMNTAIIVASESSGGSFAAKNWAANYSVTVDGVNYGDWYLPSRLELNLLYLQKGIVGSFANLTYWSSTEKNSREAWSLYFKSGKEYGMPKEATLGVRAIRSF
jgi:hypothetical protein